MYLSAFVVAVSTWGATYQVFDVYLLPFISGMCYYNSSFTAIWER